MCRKVLDFFCGKFIDFVMQFLDTSWNFLEGSRNFIDISRKFEPDPEGPKSLKDYACNGFRAGEAAPVLISDRPKKYQNRYRYD